MLPHRPDMATFHHFGSDLDLTERGVRYFHRFNHYSSVISDGSFIRVPLEIWCKLETQQTLRVKPFVMTGEN